MKRLRAKVGITYPVGDSVEVIRKAGGIRKLSPEKRARLNFKRANPGDWCDDIPDAPRGAYLAAGKIEEVEVRRTKKASK